MTRSVAQGLAAYASDSDLRAAKVRMGAAMPDDGWLHDYLRAVTPLTDAPVEFHLVSGLCALAAAVGNRLWTVSWGQSVYPHLWAVLVAPSSFWRKSTSINQAEALLREASPTSVYPSDFSREKFLRILAENPAGVLTLKEFGGFLATLGRDYMCVDAETEALTTTGWKRHDEIAVGDEIIGVEASGPTTLLRAALVTAVNRYDVADEPMVSVEGRSISMLTTANHTCVLQNQLRRPRADELRRHDRLLQVARWGGGYGPYGNSGDARAKRRDRARASLLGWFLSEGWTDGKAIRIGQKNHVDELVQALADSEWRWSESNVRADGLRNFRITGRGADKLRSWAPGKAPTFGILRSWGRRALLELFRALMLGDGYEPTPGEMAFTQRPGPVLDFFQALALRLGYRTVATHNGPVDAVSVTRHRSFSIGPDSLSEQTYTGVVWCPTSRLGTFVARRRGRVFITGNSGMKENLTELYDGPDVFSRSLTKEIIEIKRPAVTLLGATTLDWLESRITEGDLQGGFLARFLFVTASQKASAKGLTGGMDYIVRMRLRDALHDIHELPETLVEIEPDARDQLDDWMHGWEEEVGRTRHRSDLSGFAVRLQTYALKLAMLYRVSACAFVDDMPMHRLDERSVSQAIAYCRVLWSNVAVLIDDDIAVTKDAKELRRIRRIIGEGATRSDVLRLSRIKARDFDQYIDALVQGGEIASVRVRASDVGVDRMRDTQLQWLAPVSKNGHSGSHSGSEFDGLAARTNYSGTASEPEEVGNYREPEGPDSSTESLVVSSSLSHLSDESHVDSSRAPARGNGRRKPEPEDAL